MGTSSVKRACNMENRFAHMLRMGMSLILGGLGIPGVAYSQSSSDTFLEGFVQDERGNPVNGYIDFFFWQGTADDCDGQFSSCNFDVFTGTIREGRYKTESKPEPGPTQVYKVSVRIGTQTVLNTPAFPAPILRGNDW